MDFPIYKPKIYGGFQRNFWKVIATKLLKIFGISYLPFKIFRMRFLLICVIVVTYLLGLGSYTQCLNQKKSKQWKTDVGVQKSPIADLWYEGKCSFWTHRWCFIRTESLDFALNYCTIKQILHRSSRVSRHCIRHWDRSYKKYCSTSSSHVPRKCKRLKAKAAKLNEKWISSRLKSLQLKKCGDQTFDRDEYGCCRDVVYELGTQGCCSGSIFNKHTKHCCSDHLYNREIKGCCGGTPFPVETAACCNTTIHIVDGKQSRLCCGNISIDAARYFCLNGTIMVKDGGNVNSGLGGNTNTTIAAHSDSFLTNPETVVIAITVSSGVIMATIIASFLFVVCKGKTICRKLISDTHNYERVIVNNSACTSSTIVSQKTVETNLSTQSVTNSGPIDRDVFEGRPTNEHEYNADQSVLLNEHAIDTDLTMPIEFYFKSCDKSNNQDNVAVDNETQTTDLKQSNYRNSMGKPFDLQFVFNMKNKTLQMPNSAVTFTLSDADIAEDKHCLASTFRNVHDVGKKLELKEHDRVASPAVEYYFVDTKLKEPATVKMPFIGDPGNLTVLKIKSDHGSDTPINRKVLKRKDDVNRESDEEFYEIIGTGKISINVTSLSWLVCKSSTCNEEHDFHLMGHLYGGLKHSNDQDVKLKASFVFYIADEIYCVDDYKQSMEDEERTRQRLHWFKLKLSGIMSLEDYIRVSLEPNPPNIGWEHSKKTSGSDELLQAEEEEISLNTITGCHKSNQSGLPFAKKWYLTLSGEATQLECILTTAQKSEAIAYQITNEDRHVVETDKLYNQITPEEKPPGLDLNQAIVQPNSHIQQPADDQGENPNHPARGQAPALGQHDRGGLPPGSLVRGEIHSQPPFRGT